LSGTLPDMLARAYANWSQNTGSPPILLKMEEETFRQSFRRGLETSDERSFNRDGGEPNHFINLVLTQVNKHLYNLNPFYLPLFQGRNR